jgi:hypothetical protein
VRATLRLEVGDDRLDALAARLVSRLERIETVVPGASESVGGAQRLQRWLDAENAAAQPPAVASPTPTPAAAPPVQPSDAPAPTATATPVPTPTATATATPEPTVDPPVSGGEEAAAPFHPRRARWKQRLERIAHP